MKELLDKVNVDTHDSQSSYEGRVSEPTNETPSLVTQSHTPVLEKGVTALNRVTPTPISVSHSCVPQEGPRLNVFCCCIHRDTNLCLLEDGTVAVFLSQVTSEHLTQGGTF